MKKGVIFCKNCRKSVGFMLSWHVIPDVYCGACEDVVTHREEMREQSEKQYRAAVNRSLSEDSK